MEAFRSLVRGDLPPVGNSIVHFGETNKSLPEFSGYASHWVDSGTSALALAFMAAKLLRPGIVSPEVIIPGYCCPDLMAAAHYARLKIVIVDVNIDDPSLNLSCLLGAISKNTIAIVAVNFLGFFENLNALHDLKKDYPDLSIIEDNAQWFPSAAQDVNSLSGDFVTFSFGRGKPVSLLGGGLLLSRVDLPAAFLDKSVRPSTKQNLFSRIFTKGKFVAYNQLRIPFFYQLLSKNPFISLGVTRYHPLDKIVELDDLRKGLLNLNICKYQQNNSEAIAAVYDELFHRIGFRNSFCPNLGARRHKLLRYPILFSSVEQKQLVFRRLCELGLGATEMYKVALPKIDGVHDFSVMGNLENASSFAERFISLPVHSGVTGTHIQLVGRVFLETM